MTRVPSPRRLVALLGSTALLLLGITLAPRLNAAATCDTTWRIVTSPNGQAPVGGSGSALSPPKQGDTALTSVAMISSTDAWAIGRAYDANHFARTFATHWDGTAWNAVPTPNVGTADNFLNALAWTASDDVWAVGWSQGKNATATLTERWNGTAWSVVASPSVGTGDNQLTGVAVAPGGVVWAVGYSVATDGSGIKHTLIEDYDPSAASPAWQVVASPNRQTGGADTSNILYGVAAAPSGDLWAVGDYFQLNTTPTTALQTLVLRYRPSSQSWSTQSSPNVDTSPGTGGVPSTNTLTAVAASSASDAWAVGYQDNGGTLVPLTLHWDGSAWNVVANPSPSGSFDGRLLSVGALSSSDVWATGASFVNKKLLTLIEHWDGSQWSILSSPNLGTKGAVIDGIAASGPPQPRLLAAGLSWYQTGAKTLIEQYCEP